MDDPTQFERPPAIVLKQTTTMVSPLTNASVASSKGTTKLVRDASKASERRKSPLRSPSVNTARKAVRRSPRRNEATARKRLKTTSQQKGKKTGATKERQQEEDNSEDSKYEAEDTLSFDEEEELPVDGTVDLDDVDDARMVADVDQGNQTKQIMLKKKSIKFEKQYVVLAPRTGRKISATAFAKNYFQMASLTDEGKRLVKGRDGMLCGCCLCCVPCLFLTFLLPLSFKFHC
jgi:hypothetical protein